MRRSRKTRLPRRWAEGTRTEFTISIERGDFHEFSCLDTPHIRRRRFRGAHDCAGTPRKPRTSAGDGASSISLNKAKYFAEHPGAYKDFLAHLPKPGVNTSEGVAARAVPGTGGSWTALAAAPSGGNGLYAPHLLTDGSVLFEAGTNAQWYKLTPDNTGSYVNGTYSTIALLPVINGQQYAPLYHASAVLPDGRLVIVGGEYNANQVNNQSDQGGNVYTNLGAIYDPIANKWTNVPQPSNFPSNYNGYLGTIGVLKVPY